MTVRLRAKGVRLSSDEECKLAEIFEWNSVTDGTFSDKMRALILLLHSHGSAHNGALPPVQCEKPQCIMFTELDKAKYECTEERENKTPHTKKIHLQTCQQCQLQKQQKLEERKQREKRILDSINPTVLGEGGTVKTEPSSHIHVLSPVFTPKPTPCQPKIEVKDGVVNIGDLTFSVVDNWNTVLKSDNTKMCPFTGKYVSLHDCKTCKQTNKNTMFSACLQVHWQEQKKQGLTNALKPLQYNSVTTPKSDCL